MPPASHQDPVKYLPIFLSVEGRPCVVIGGGSVAHHKVSVLLEAGASITVISPVLVPEFADWIARQRIAHINRAYEAGDLAGALLAFAATDDPDTQAAVAAEAAACAVLLNVVDVPPACQFVMPAFVRRDDLLIAVSTSGASPSVAKRIRDELSERYDAPHGEALRIYAALRQHASMATVGAPRRKQIFGALAASDLVDHVRQRDSAAIDRLLRELAGSAISLASLGVKLR